MAFLRPRPVETSGPLLTGISPKHHAFCKDASVPLPSSRCLMAPQSSQMSLHSYSTSLDTLDRAATVCHVQVIQQLPSRPSQGFSSKPQRVSSCHILERRRYNRCPVLTYLLHLPQTNFPEHPPIVSHVLDQRETIHRVIDERIPARAGAELSLIVWGNRPSKDALLPDDYRGRNRRPPLQYS